MMLNKEQHNKMMIKLLIHGTKRMTVHLAKNRNKNYNKAWK